jgi:uncharacterized protein YdhG (YjbR/CyaY superfamily)
MAPAAKAKAKSKTSSASKTFTAEERAAIKEYVAERNAQRGRGASKEEGEADVLAKIAEMADPDRAIAQRLHAVITEAAPSLAPRTWYGMPAYAKDGKVLCFYQSAQKFKTRYGTIGFSDKANLDDGDMWPTAFALKELNGATEARIVSLIEQAVS